MLTRKITTIKANSVPFTAFALKEQQLVWLDEKAYQKYSSHHNIADIEKHFKDDFSFSTASELMAESRLSKNEKKFLAERYGGRGIGVNGGAARCGNFGQLQVKGIGPTPLVGESTNKWYSNGGLSLIDAVYEAVFASILNEILPLGAVNCVGIICTGDDTAYPSHHKSKTGLGRGALLVREVAARPGHFFPITDFKIKQQYKHRLNSEQHRIRQVNKTLAQQFSSPNDFILYLGSFLQNSANQFAFAKAFRLCHGAITPSNIAFDGRWLDLTTASFLDGGKNYILNFPNEAFFTEHNAPLQIINELLYHNGKYNFTELNAAPLVNYYNEQYDAYFNYHFARVIGLPADSTVEKVTNSAAYEKLVSAYKKVLLADNEKIKLGRERAKAPDPVTEFITALFTELNQKKALAADNLSYNLNVVIKSYYRKAQSKVTVDAFKKISAIRALRQLYYIPIFYRSELKNNLSEDIETAEVSTFGDIIAQYRDLARWMFNDTNNESCIIFKLKQIEITFESKSENFFLASQNEKKFYSSADKLIATVETMEDKQLTFNYYNFKRSIITLLQAIV